MTAFAIDPHRLEDMLNHCLSFAKMMVEKHGEFHPFGAVIDSAGALISVGGYTGEHPKGAEVYRLLQDSMRSQYSKGEIVAGAVAADVNIPTSYQPPFPDGIRVLLECRGFSRFIYLPYRVLQAGVEYADFIPVDVPPSICVGDHNG
jgi:hypothetical protein